MNHEQIRSGARARKQQKGCKLYKHWEVRTANLGAAVLQLENQCLNHGAGGATSSAAKWAQGSGTGEKIRLHVKRFTCDREGKDTGKAAMAKVKPLRLRCSRYSLSVAAAA